MRRLERELAEATRCAQHEHLRRLHAEIAEERTRLDLEREEYRSWQAQEESRRVFEEARRQRHQHDMARNVALHQVHGESLEDRGTRFINSAIREERASRRPMSRGTTRRPEASHLRRRRIHIGEDIGYVDEDDVRPRRTWYWRSRRF